MIQFSVRPSGSQPNVPFATSGLEQGVGGLNSAPANEAGALGTCYQRDWDF